MKRILIFILTLIINTAALAQTDVSIAWSVIDASGNVAVATPCQVTKLIITGIDVSGLSVGDEDNISLTFNDPNIPGQDAKLDLVNGKLTIDLDYNLAKLAQAAADIDVTVKLSHVTSASAAPLIVALQTPKQFTLKLAKADCNPKDYEERYAEAIAKKLSEDFDLNEKTENGVYIDNNIVHVFLDQDGELIGGLDFPSVVSGKNRHRYRVIILADKAKYNKENFLVKIEGSPFSSGGKLVIGESDLVRAGAKSADQDKIELTVIQSEVYGPFSDYASFQVFRKEATEEKFQELIFEDVLKIESFRPYHVTVLGGFYYSSLSDPQNIVQGALPGGNGTDQTLFADFAESQRALTVMAVFYPKPRDPEYVYKELPFMRKVGFAFGTKISEDLFDDLLLGINYEFSKGGNFTLGTHFGKHTVVRGFDDFEFGKTVYTPTFSNDQLSEAWGFGLFAGITIDFRIIGDLRRSARRERDANAPRGNQETEATSTNPGN